MSFHDYETSLEIGAGRYYSPDPPFAALIMAAMRKADSDNLLRLQHAFPLIWQEFLKRYRAPDGVLPEDNRR